MSKTIPSYYAILPAEVRYDTELTAQAKLLYAEITALAENNGYCFASNKYFAELYNLSEWTISTTISLLQNKGYLQVEIDKENGNKRKIFVGNTSKKQAKTGTLPIVKNHKTYCEKPKDPIVKNPKTPIVKNPKIIIQDINNTRRAEQYNNKTQQDAPKTCSAPLASPLCVNELEFVLDAAEVLSNAKRICPTIWRRTQDKLDKGNFAIVGKIEAVLADIRLKPDQLCQVLDNAEKKWFAKAGRNQWDLLQVLKSFKTVMEADFE